MFKRINVPCVRVFTNSQMLRHALCLLMNVGFLFITFLPGSFAPCLGEFEKHAYERETRGKDIEVEPLAQIKIHHMAAQKLGTSKWLKMSMARNEVDLFDPQSRTINSATHPPSAQPHRFWKKNLNRSLSLLRRESLAVCSEHASLASPNLPRSCSNTAFRRYLCQVASRLFWNKLNFFAVVFLSFPPGACRKACILKHEAQRDVVDSGRFGHLLATSKEETLTLNYKHLQMMSSFKNANVSWGAGFFFKPPMNAQALAHSDGLDIKWFQKRQRASKMSVSMGLWVDVGGWVCECQHVHMYHTCWFQSWSALSQS